MKPAYIRGGYQNTECTDYVTNATENGCVIQPHHLVYQLNTRARDCNYRCIRDAANGSCNAVLLRTRYVSISFLAILSNRQALKRFTSLRFTATSTPSRRLIHEMASFERRICFMKFGRCFNHRTEIGTSVSSYVAIIRTSVQRCFLFIFKLKMVLKPEKNYSIS